MNLSCAEAEVFFDPCPFSRRRTLHIFVGPFRTVAEMVPGLLLDSPHYIRTDHGFSTPPSYGLVWHSTDLLLRARFHTRPFHPLFFDLVYTLRWVRANSLYDAVAECTAVVLELSPGVQAVVLYDCFLRANLPNYSVCL